MGCLGIFLIPAAGTTFFFSAWIVMLFWGMVAPDVGLRTISYSTGMLVTIGLWLAVAPLIEARRRWR